jgi:hypothetical protein
MTIQEAIESNKPFKRKQKLLWMIVEREKWVMSIIDKDGNIQCTFNPTIDDILDDDWEIDDE